MNRKSKSLQMTKTTYANSHGLMNQVNKSCAHDMAVLSEYCMRNPYFKSIVSCKSYTNTIRVENEEKNVVKESSTYKSSTKAGS